MLLITDMLLTCTHQGIGIFINMNCLVMTGTQSPWLHHGWNLFMLPPPKCPQQRFQCFQQLMLFSVDFKMISRTFFDIFQPLFFLLSSMALSMHTQSSVIIITRMMSHLSIHGLHLSNCFTISYDNSQTSSSIRSTHILWRDEAGLCKWSNAFWVPWAIEERSSWILWNPLC